jgi:GWxTD domain-containing protein
MGLRHYAFKTLLLLGLLLSACFGPPPKIDQTALDSCYSQADRFFKAGEIDSSLVYLNNCFKLDHHYAPAHYLLGQIYLQKDGIYNRRLSALSLKEAIKAQADNPEYHYSLGITLEKQGFPYNALDEYKKAAELDSTDSRPYIRIAAINEKFGLRYDDRGYFKRALEASSKAAKISDDPAQYYHQATTLYQMGSYDSSKLALSEAIAKTDSNGLLAQCYLLLGTELVQQGKFDSADIAFNEGRKHLNEIARDEMDDVRYLMPPSEYAKFRNESYYYQNRMSEQLWGSLDPDPTTEINERKLVHYARYVHAQLTFSIPDRSIEGWKTKRGELYIRYGPPSEQSYGLTDDTNGVPRWIWTYNQFKEPAVFVFDDTFLNGDFNFPFPDKKWTADDFAKDPARLAEMLGSSVPEIFDFKPGTGPLKYSFLPRQFKGRGGKTDLEVFVAIPYTELKFTSDDGYASATIDWRQVLRYPDWQIADSIRAIRTYKGSASQTENSTLSMSDKLPLSEYPESLIFAISIKDTLSGHAGITTKEFRLRNFYTGKAEISDIILARRIDQPPGKLNFSRQELNILSNLDNHYFSGEPVLLYFEIYNLAKGPDGKTSYSIKQTISSKRQGGILGSVKRVIGANDLEQVVTTYEGSSINSDENRILSLDVSQFEAGNYTISIEINDQISGKSALASQEIILYK